MLMLDLHQDIQEEFALQMMQTINTTLSIHMHSHTHNMLKSSTQNTSIVKEELNLKLLAIDMEWEELLTEIVLLIDVLDFQKEF